MLELIKTDRNYSAQKSNVAHVRPVYFDEVEGSRRTPLSWASRIPFFAQIYELLHG